MHDRGRPRPGRSIEVARAQAQADARHERLADRIDACAAYEVRRVEQVLERCEQLERAARATRTTYIDVWSASKGHDICSDTPWVNGAVSDQDRAAAYHPFAEEQQAVADLITQELGRG